MRPNKRAKGRQRLARTGVVRLVTSPPAAVVCASLMVSCVVADPRVGRLTDALPNWQVRLAGRSSQARVMVSANVPLAARVTVAAPGCVVVMVRLEGATVRENVLGGVSTEMPCETDGLCNASPP